MSTTVKIVAENALKKLEEIGDEWLPGYAVSTRKKLQDCVDALNAALQHQEVPCGNTPYDEGPFTTATDGGQEVPREPSEEMMTAGLRAACLYDTPESRRDLARAWKVMSALYASPSTTRQQEVPHGQQ